MQLRTVRPVRTAFIVIRSRATEWPNEIASEPFLVTVNELSYSINGYV